MLRGRIKSILLGCTSLGVLLVATAAANAGGFALREQSAYGQGSSFAGIAAGGALSSMFWNPATITQFNGKTVEQVVTGILPSASHSYSTATLGAFGNAPSNSGIDAVVPSGYASWQFNEKLWLGLSMNAPFGLGVHFPQLWAGSQYGQSSKVESYNFSPTIAYKINDWISVAVGAQAQYMKVSYDAFISAAPLLIGSINGAGWGWGWTAGVTLTPTSTTTLGIGYRSAINQDINGTLNVPVGVAGSTRGSVNTTLNLPDMLTIGLRQRLTDRFTLLAGYEWSGWSRIGTAVVRQPNGAPATIGGTAVALPFQYSDGQYVSIGGEYVINQAWTARAGIGFEKSPITDNVRTPRLPDADRIWYSVGASYKPASIRGLTLDVGYSYIDVKDASVCLGLASGCPTNPWSGATTYVGSVRSHVNIVSIGVRYQWDADPAVTKQVYHK